VRCHQPDPEHLVVQVAELAVQEETRQQLVAQAIRHPHRHRKAITVAMLRQRVAGNEAVAVVVVQVLLVQMAQVELMAVLVVLVLRLQSVGQALLAGVVVAAAAAQLLALVELVAVALVAM